MWLCSSSVWRTQRSLVGCSPAWTRRQVLSSSIPTSPLFSILGGNPLTPQAEHYHTKPLPFFSFPSPTKHPLRPLSSQSMMTKLSTPPTTNHHHPMNLSISFPFPLKTIPTTFSLSASPSRPQSGQAGANEIVARQKNIHDAIELLNLDAGLCVFVCVCVYVVYFCECWLWLGVYLVYPFFHTLPFPSLPLFPQFPLTLFKNWPSPPFKGAKQRVMLLML